MNKLFYPVLCVAVLMLMQSCTVTTPGNYSTRKATAKTRYVTESSISETALVTDLVVEEKKVSGSFSGRNINEDEAKNIAVFDAIKRAGAEILVEPLFEIQINNNEISVKVEGYPARYTNFRKPTHDDSLVLGLIAPAADTVIVEIETKIITGSGGGGCCCGNSSGNVSASGTSGKSTSTTIYNNASVPATGTNPFTLSSAPPVDNTKPSGGTMETEKFKTDYINEYKRLKSKGRSQLKLGGAFFYLLPVSIPLFIAGGSNKGKAKRMKLDAPQHGINISLQPIELPAAIETSCAEQSTFLKNQQ